MSRDSIASKRQGIRDRPVATLNFKQIVCFVFVRTYFKRLLLSSRLDTCQCQGDEGEVKMQIELNKVIRNYLTNSGELQSEGDGSSSN